MIWFPLSIGAAIFWSFSQILLKKGLENIPPLWNNLINNFLSLVIWVPVALIINGFRINPLTPEIAFVISLAAFFYLFFIYALSKGKVSLVGTIVAVYPVWTIILSYFFLNEKINTLQKFCIFLIILSSILISIPEKLNKKEVKQKNSWIFWGFLASILIGAGDFLAKYSINRIGVYSNMIYLSIFSNIMSLFNYIVDKKSRRLPSKDIKPYMYTISGIVLSLIGSFQFQLAFQYGKASLVTPISSTYPAITVILAMKFLKETLVKRQLIAVSITVISLILLGISL